MLKLLLHLLNISLIIFSPMAYSQNTISNIGNNGPVSRNSGGMKSYAARISDKNASKDLTTPERFKRLTSVPGEVIVKYKRIMGVRGKEITNEYDSFMHNFTNLTNLDVKQAGALYCHLVNDMILKNLSERELNALNIDRFNALKKSSSITQQVPSFEFSRTLLIKLNDEDVDLNSALERITNNRASFLRAGFEIEYAEPNYLYYTESVPNDPLYPMQWAHKVTKAEAAWDIEKGSRDIIIGVIDSGVDILHEDLKANILPGKSYDFVDTDTTAFISGGFKLLSGEDYTIPDNNPADYLGHGTHCAGIIGASGNNNLGVTGVCQNISIMALRAGFSIIDYFGNEAGLLENAAIVNAINYAANNGARILSMSFGSSFESKTMKEAINYAQSLGIIIIAAAGNDSRDLKYFPAAYDNVVSVSATDSYGIKAGFSNYGNWISVAAPGELIYSTVPKTGGFCTNSSGYLSLSGTSMAAPYVSGLAGLLLSKNPALKAEEINWIIRNSTDIPTRTVFYIGTGQINLLKALQSTPLSSVCDAKAEITSPSEADCFSNDIIITGNAGGSSYKLYYGKGLYPTEWKEVGSGGSATGGIIGSLKVRDLPEGRYSIKLIVNNSKGTNEARISIFVINYSDMKAGWPQKLPSIYADINPISDNLQVDDLDGDGELEIIIVGGVSSSTNFKWAQSIYIFNPGGTLIKSWPLISNGFTKTEPILLDLDNDRKKEILVLVFGGDNTALRGRGCVQIYKYDGSQFPGWPKNINVPGEIAGFSAADINMDGKPEIIAATGGGCCFDSTNVGAMHVFNTDGTYLKNWPVNFSSNYVPRSNLVIANIDEDPAPEIIFTIVNQVNINGQLNYTCALKADGTQAAGFPKKQVNWGCSLAAVDINDDGINEILLQNEIIDNKGRAMTWNQPNMDVYSNFAIADVNNDQKPEVLFGNGTAKGFLTDCKGNLLPGWPKQEEDFSADRKNIIADIDGDYIPEIIILWGNTPTSSIGKMPGIFAYKADGSVVKGFPKFKDVLSIKSLAVTDIDNDGLVDLVGIDSKHSIFVIGLQKKYTTTKSEWPSTQHDPWHSSSALGNKVKILSDIKIISLTENDSLNLLISPVYVNWNNYIVSAMSDCGKVTVSVRNGTLSIKPEPFWYGSAEIKVSVSNSFMSEAKNFQLKVTKKNYVPIRIKNLPEVSLNEDVDSSIIISNLYDYYRNVEMKNGLNFSCKALDKGLDSLKIDKKESSSNINITETVSLKVYPAKYFHGIVRLFITATDDSLASLSDTLRLNINHVNHRPQLSALKDISIMEDDSIKFILSAVDIDGDKLEYSASAESKNIKTFIRKDTLYIVPDKYWHGTSMIRVGVNDGLETDSVSVKLNVSHVNHPPMAFQLLLPPHNSVFSISSNPSDTLVISWENALDVDRDSLTYGLFSSDSLQLLKTERTKINKLILPFAYIRKIIDENKLLRLKGTWAIVAMME